MQRSRRVAIWPGQSVGSSKDLLFSTVSVAQFNPFLDLSVSLSLLSFDLWPATIAQDPGRRQGPVTQLVHPRPPLSQ